MENTEGCPTPLIRNPTSKIMEDNNDKSLRGLNLLGEDSGALMKKVVVLTAGNLCVKKSWGCLG